MEYQVRHNAEQAYHNLRKRGIDLNDTAGLLPDIQALMSEICAAVQPDTQAEGPDDREEEMTTG